MADIKITQLNEASSLEDNDIVPVVDVSDTALASSGATKKTLLSTLKAFLKTYFDAIYATVTNQTITIGGDSTNPGAVLIKPANTAYNWYALVNKETGSSQGFAIQRGAYPQVVSVTFAVTAAGEISTPLGVFSPSGYQMMGSNTISSPVDSTTYYFGASNYVGSTYYGYYRFWIPRSGTIKRILIENFYSGTQPSNETSTINMKINNGSNIVINTGFHNEVNGLGFITTLSQAVSVGDYIEFNWVTPAWETNPGTSITLKTWVYVE